MIGSNISVFKYYNNTYLTDTPFHGQSTNILLSGIVVPLNLFQMNNSLHDVVLSSHIWIDVHS